VKLRLDHGSKPILDLVEKTGVLRIVSPNFTTIRPNWLDRFKAHLEASRKQNLRVGVLRKSNNFSVQRGVDLCGLPTGDWFWSKATGSPSSSANTSWHAALNGSAPLEISRRRAMRAKPTIDTPR